MAHKINEVRGAYDEDYHYYTYTKTSSGDYNCHKIIVATNGTTRTIFHEILTDEEYFKRKLDGNLKEKDEILHQHNVQ